MRWACRSSRIRYAAVLYGGAMAGLGGAYLSLAYTPMWGENMTAGRGWIALALVVFATWRPWRLVAGAYLFAMVTQLQFYGQDWGLQSPRSSWRWRPIWRRSSRWSSSRATSR